MKIINYCLALTALVAVANCTLGFEDSALYREDYYDGLYNSYNQKKIIVRAFC